MEYCMAAEIAWRAGYDKLEVVNVGWDALIAGQTSDFDLALSEISITEERKKVRRFLGALFQFRHRRAGAHRRAGRREDDQEAKVGVQQATTGAAFATDKLGLTNVQVYPDQGDMFTALRAGQIDAAMTDTSIIAGRRSGQSGGKVAWSSANTRPARPMARIYPKGNANNATIDKIIQSMIDDGTMAKLGAKYLAAAWGKDPATVPYFNP